MALEQQSSQHLPKPNWISSVFLHISQWSDLLKVAILAYTGDHNMIGLSIYRNIITYTPLWQLILSDKVKNSLNSNDMKCLKMLNNEKKIHKTNNYIIREKIIQQQSATQNVLSKNNQLYFSGEKHLMPGHNMHYICSVSNLKKYKAFKNTKKWIFCSNYLVMNGNSVATYFYCLDQYKFSK